MKIEHYTKASSLTEASDLLHQDSTNAILGGGAWMKLTNKTIGTLIDISGLGLDQIEESDDAVTIGSMTTLRQLETSPIVQSLDDGILSRAAGSIMGINVRNIATIGGSIMGKYSFSDVITPLLAMDATLVFHNRPPMKLETFLHERHNNPDILIAITLPKALSKAYFYYVKKTAMDFAVINIAIVRRDTIRIAVGARPGGATLASTAMTFVDQNQTKDIADEAARLASNDIHVGSNVRASDDYRKELIKVYVRRGLEEVLQ